MPVLITKEHEQFAQALAKGEMPTPAYAKIYGTDPTTPSTRVAASRLKGKVAVRVLEINGGAPPLSTIGEDLVVKASKSLAKKAKTIRQEKPHPEADKPRLQPREPEDYTIADQVTAVIEDASRRIKDVAVEAMERIGTFLTISERRALLAQIVRTPLSEIGPESVLCQEYTKRTILGGETRPDAEVEKIKKPDILTALKLDAQMAGELTTNETTVNVGNVQSITVVLPPVIATPRIPPRIIDAHSEVVANDSPA